MTTGTTEAVVEIEMTECGVEIVAPEKIDDAPSKPDAFGVAGGALQQPLGLGELVRFLLPVLARLALGLRLIGPLLLGIRLRVRSRADHDEEPSSERRSQFTQT